MIKPGSLIRSRSDYAFIRKDFPRDISLREPTAGRFCDGDLAVVLECIEQQTWDVVRILTTSGKIGWIYSRHFEIL